LDTPAGQPRISYDGPASAELTCQGCGRHGAQPFELALVRAGETGPWLSFFRCPDCASLTGKGDVGLHRQASPYGALAGQLARRTAVELFCSFGRQIYGLRSFRGFRPERMLDVGCGLGVGPDCASILYGCQATGIDPSEDAAYAAKALSFPLIEAYYDPSAPPAGGPFDLIQAWELIEHLERPRAMIESFRSQLSPEGLLLLSTPAAEAVTRDADPAQVIGALAPPSHLHLFSERALVSLLRAAGFKEVEAERIGDQIVVAAVEVLPERCSAEEGWALYRDYLERRAATLPDGGDFKRGFQARRLFQALSEGGWREVDALLAWFDRDLERCWNIILERDSERLATLFASPPSPEKLTGLPIPLALVIFAQARQAQRSQDKERAVSLFMLSAAAGRFTQASLSPLGLMDVMLARLTERAAAFAEEMSAHAG
jgi:SAM-dependent methyltransferase